MPETNSPTFSIDVSETSEFTVTLHQDGKDDYSLTLREPECNNRLDILKWLNALKEVLHDKYGETIYE